MSRSAVRARAHRAWRHLLAVPDTPDRSRYWEDVRRSHPGFVRAVTADARITASRRGERRPGDGRLDRVVQVLRLMLVTESFAGQVSYRAKAALQARRVPLLPRVMHHLAVSRGQIVIGDPVVVEPGVFVPHGQIVIDGITRIGEGATISPFTTIGLRSGDFVGPTIGRRAEIGTGSRVLGPWTIGEGARIGANAVVTGDVAAETVVVGVPARPLDASR